MNGVWAIGPLIDWTSGYFGKYGIPDPRLEAEMLLSEVLHCPRLQLALRRNDVVPPDRLREFKEFIVERQKRKPIAYILGAREFMGLHFFVDEHTLIPRPETEILVETAIKHIGEGHADVIVDLCTGSGCIAVSTAVLSDARKVYACDISLNALKVAQANIDYHGQGRKVFVKFGDLFHSLDDESLEGKVDIVVSNPPYISHDEIKYLEPELAFEPRLALDGGKDGMDYYRRIAQAGKLFLKDGGHLLLELSAARSAAIRAVVADAGFVVQEIIKDYAGLDRVLVARR